MILYPVRVQSQEFVDRGDRDHLPVGQHRDTVADGVERVEVVCDEEDGKAERVAQLRDELVEAGGADRVEAGGRLVEEQKLRVEREGAGDAGRSEEHTSELQSLMRISYAVFCLKKKKNH